MSWRDDKKQAEYVKDVDEAAEKLSGTVSDNDAEEMFPGISEAEFEYHPPIPAVNHKVIYSNANPTERKSSANPTVRHSQAKPTVRRSSDWRKTDSD